jgi:hypothetical protein
MAKIRRRPTERGRLSWDGRLSDPAGVVYERHVEELTKGEALALLAEGDVQVAVSLASRPLRWLSTDERHTVWRQEVAPNFHDAPNWRPPRDAPGNFLSTRSCGRAEIGESCW